MDAHANGSVAEQLAAVRAALRTTTQQLKQERQRDKAERKKRAKMWLLTGWVAHVVLIVFMLSGQHVDPAVKFLVDFGRRRKWEPKEDDELKTMVEDLFLAVDLDVLTELCDLANPSDPAAAKEAVRISEEWRLAQWVKRLNEQQGVAPSTDMVLGNLEAHRAELPEAIRPPWRGVAAEARARAWAYRWRRRWGARHGKLPVRPVMAPEEMWAKARQGEIKQAFFFGNFEPQTRA